MGLLSRLFGSRNGSKGGPPEQEVEVHFDYGSTNFQYAYALEDKIRLAIAEAKVGEYDGHELPADGSEGRYFAYGPDAEAIFKVITPVLEASPIMRGATVTLHFGPRRWKTPKRVIKLPS
ncbi:MAG TPA: hypothetical protein VGP19_04075 [Candidatus Acidoferrales bacterium]|jgi:hypothetical protein|nr:hypothetical protein [Candidatus Acidoferrales bacterium]